jgi:hypothetical protein
MSPHEPGTLVEYHGAVHLYSAVSFSANFGWLKTGKNFLSNGGPFIIISIESQYMADPAIRNGYVVMSDGVGYMNVRNR